MSEPTKLVPLLAALVPEAIDAVKRRFEAYPRLVLELAPAPVPLPVLGFGIPGGMRRERRR